MVPFFRPLCGDAGFCWAPRTSVDIVSSAEHGIWLGGAATDH